MSIRVIRRRIAKRDSRLIVSFRDVRTAQAFDGIAVKGFPADLLKVTRRKLRMLHRATNLSDLRSPPRNMLEQLQGDRAGQHSIRVNKQFRICFVWIEGDAHSVEFVDYHR